MRLLLALLILCSTSSAFAANFFVDPFTGSHSDETWDGTDGHSYSSTITNAPSTGVGYSTVQAAVDAMSGGDDLYLRGGTYGNSQLGSGTYNSVIIPDTLDGTSGDYTSIQSFPSEWAVLDGESNIEEYSVRPLGLLSSGTSGARTTDYLRLERFEVKNGINTAVDSAVGLCIGGRGNIFRYLYIHDNYGGDGNNPSGIRGYGWRDVVVEYNYFADNGVSQAAAGSYNGNNSGHITPFSNYDSATVSQNGPGVDYEGTFNNIIRYNYFLRGGAGYKVKGNQLLTGRGVGDFETTYADQGDWIHHNIFVDAVSVPIKIKGDFTTANNNIIDNSHGGIIVGFENEITGVTLFNNTIIGSRNTTWSFSPIWHHAQGDSGWTWQSKDDLYTFEYNNIITDNVDLASGKGAWHMGRYTSAELFDLSHVTVKNMYFYNDDDGDVMSTYSSTGSHLYTATEWETAFTGDVPIYSGSGGSPTLFQGTTGTDQYKINSAHIVEGTTEAGGAGSGGTHPYRSLSIPSYIGAVNPNDDEWVDGVLALDTTYFTSATAGSDPTWIERATPSSHPLRTGTQLLKSGTTTLR